MKEKGKVTKVGIIGCGMIAEWHARGYQTVPNCKIGAICDIDEEKLRDYGDRYGIPVENRYTHIGKMLRDADIDCVDVCLHNNLHVPVAIEAMKKGKNVYCEKPMSGSWFDSKAMYDTSIETGRMLHVQINLIYTDGAKGAKRLIDGGRIGKIYHMRSYGFRRRGRPYVDGYGPKEFVIKDISGGGAIFDMGVYHISQLLYLSNSPKLERVTGNTYSEMEMDPVRKEISGYNVEDMGCGLAHFEGNITMDILESWAINVDSNQGSLIIGDKGGICVDPLRYYSLVEDMEMTGTFDLERLIYRNSTVHAEREDPYKNSQQHWIAAQQGICPLLPSAKIGLDTQLIQEGIYFSKQLGREVTADEIRKMSVSKTLEIPNLYL